ncbi:hypothetical protein PVA45_02130 [Entomospira entomophila]|uniref:DUF4340 domain-containing protein n=1 Tax=Entomospira entomophila TaxID=2719988 RepID=A0A968G973_9SPIO|nr:hypothetical protein [Entomospira entomophilus]NIZ40311.1 hypothetical protein [Entomospira entomophilus]WDI35870.1 hypothetical protein PVA45_02130 [Entomospira entomophilus]
MRRLTVLIYIGILGASIYFAYKWNQDRLPERVRIRNFVVEEVVKVSIERQGVTIYLEPNKQDDQQWIFSTTLDRVRSFSIDAQLIRGLLDSLVSAQYAYLVERGGLQSLQRYGLGQQEKYTIQVWTEQYANPYTFTVGALAVNGYDTFLLLDEHVYRASFVGLYERMTAMGKVVDLILGSEDRLFS